ncbi:hypothetical protein [Actibacterium pelagium]|uniref:Uncharacterized protein n=1 Tax=Actibacterium pelagium TaxID=2029103 RepID=A0A917AEU3_9RHOB|nr:hypothetical protein [Actibacterium pelagium]GGE47045.1 hypothetical protein GCM10011517_13500 [Actibacterium pelagium]
MPKLIRLYIQQVLIGFGLSALFLGMLLLLDIGGLQGLVLGSSAGYLAGVMLFMGNGIIFAGAQFAFKILMMAERRGGPKGGKRIPLRSYATAPVSVEK